MSEKPEQAISFSAIKKTRRNKSKYLEERFGGKWKYSQGYWDCDDNVRYVMKTASCHCDDLCNHWPRYFLYHTSGVTPPLEITWDLI